MLFPVVPRFTLAADAALKPFNAELKFFILSSTFLLNFIGELPLLFLLLIPLSSLLFCNFARFLNLICGLICFFQLLWHFKLITDFQFKNTYLILWSDWLISDHGFATAFLNTYPEKELETQNRSVNSWRYVGKRYCTLGCSMARLVGYLTDQRQARA